MALKVTVIEGALFCDISLKADDATICSEKQVKHFENFEAAGSTAEILTRDYLCYLKEKKNRSAMTLDFYGKDLDQFVEFIANGNPKPQTSGQTDSLPLPSELNALILDLNQQKAQRYVDEFLSQHYSPSTVTRKVTAVRGLYNYLKNTHRLDCDPFGKVSIPQNHSAEIEYLEEDQLQKLFDVISGDNWLAYRDRAIVALLYCTGVRVSELLNMTVEDIDRQRETVQIHSVAGAPRESKLPTWATEVLWQYIDQRQQHCTDLQNEPRLFINCDSGPLNARSIRRKLKEYSRRAGLSVEATPAVLRHTCAMHMLLNGANVKIVRRVLGHLSASSMRPYLKCLDKYKTTSAAMLELTEVSPS